MFLTLKKEFLVWNGNNQIGKRDTKIPAGRHEVEIIPNPFPIFSGDWIVLKGTKIGAAKAWWDQFTNKIYTPADLHVLIE